jgi:hypothetical protein
MSEYQEAYYQLIELQQSNLNFEGSHVVKIPYLSRKITSFSA